MSASEQVLQAQRCSRPGCNHPRLVHPSGGACTTTVAQCKCTKYQEPKTKVR